MIGKGLVSRAKKESGSRKRKKGQTGASGSDSEGREVGRRDPKSGFTNMVVRFEKEGGGGGEET